MVSLNSQPLKTADKGSAILIIGHDSCEQKIKNEINKMQLSGVRDSLLSASSAFNGQCLRPKSLKGKLPFS